MAGLKFYLYPLEHHQNKSQTRFLFLLKAIISTELDTLRIITGEVNVDTAEIIEKLPGWLNPITLKENADAAVALLLRNDLNSLGALFVRRVKNPNDLWSGQIALPGGKRDSQDSSLKQTVIREVFEETNIDLTNRCHFLGTMSIQRSYRKPDMKILPFVVLLKLNPLIQLNEELVCASWISIDSLAENRKTVELNHKRSPAFTVRDFCIWGLTYRILENFLKILDDL